MAKEKEDKVILERVYVVPLRRKFQNTPQYKRTPKAIKALKEFLAKHMKVMDRDTDLIRLDRYLNEEMWYHGIRRPLAKVKVRAKKFESGIVKVELAEVPAYVKFKIDKDKKMSAETEKKKEEKRAEQETSSAETKEEKKEEKTEQEKSDEKEKVTATMEAGLEQQKQAAKQIKHQVQTQHQIKKPLARKTLQK